MNVPHLLLIIGLLMSIILWGLSAGWALRENDVPIAITSLICAFAYAVMAYLAWALR